MALCCALTEHHQAGSRSGETMARTGDHTANAESTRASFQDGQQLGEQRTIIFKGSLGYFLADSDAQALRWIRG